MNNAARPSAVAGPVVLTGAWLLLMVSWLGQLVLVVPTYEARFAEQQLQLPERTVAALEVSRWAVKYWYVVVLTLVPGAVFVAVVSHLVARSGRGWRVLWPVVLLGIPVLAHAWLWLSVVGVAPD